MEINKDTFSKILYDTSVYELMQYAQNKTKTYKAVKAYIAELIGNLNENYKFNEIVFTESIQPERVNEMMLNGAKNFTYFSRGGSSLCYVGDIAERCNEDIDNPNLLDIQGHYLFLASCCIKSAYKRLQFFALAEYQNKPILGE